MFKSGLASCVWAHSLVQNVKSASSSSIRHDLNLIRTFSSDKTKTVSDSVKQPIHSCNVATIGHHQHGKTTLTDALRELSAKKFSFELQPSLNRNETNASLSEYFGESQRIFHTDCPGK